jgi:hypothetical protein
MHAVKTTSLTNYKRLPRLSLVPKFRLQCASGSEFQKNINYPAPGFSHIRRFSSNLPFFQQTA